MSQKKFEGSITGFFVLLVVVIIVVVPLGAIYYNAVKSFIPSGNDLRTYATGFLGTKASTASDLSLLAFIFLLVPLMLIGFRYARRNMFAPHHKFVMTTVTVANWGIILYLMAVSYSAGVAPGIPDKLNQPFYLLPSFHLLTGLTAQLIATVSVIRMWFEYRLPTWLRYEPIKPQMRLTLALWLITALLGIATYLNWYGVPFSAGARPTPAATAPVRGTEESTKPAILATEEATKPAPAATQSR